MKQFFLVLKVVASNWKKAKGQLIFTILGIAIASTLWSSIDIVNNQTIKAQKQSIDLLKSAFKPIIIDRELPYVSQGDYLNLRLNGWIVNPVIRAPLEGSDITIIGIDFLADRKKITLSQNNGSFGNFLELQASGNDLLFGSGKTFEALETGIFSPNLKEMEKLSLGEVGYIATGLKNLSDCRVGETITLKDNPSINPLKGYESAKPMVYSGLYPTDGDEYPFLRDALGKLQLNDASFVFEPESSGALGFGFRCGFLGLLHMDIIQERLEREYDIDLIVTAPTVKYTVETLSGLKIEVDDPSKWPEDEKINKVFEPFVDMSIVCPSSFIGPVIDLVVKKRGEYKKMDWLQGSEDKTDKLSQRVLLEFNMPLAEILTDFHSQLKSATKGYASMDYNITEPKDGKLVKLQVLVNQEKVDALSMIVHSENSQIVGRQLVSKLKELIPRQMFDIPIQAAVGSKIISRETVKALRKNVTAKCYGGDISRKRKLLQKQAEGKKRMKRLGSVEVPQEAFMAVLKNEAK